MIFSSIQKKGQKNGQKKANNNTSKISKDDKEQDGGLVGREFLDLPYPDLGQRILFVGQRIHVCVDLDSLGLRKKILEQKVMKYAFDCSKMEKLLVVVLQKVNLSIPNGVNICFRRVHC